MLRPAKTDTTRYSKMKKRIVIKIGDVFAVPIARGWKRYFQFISRDSHQLNSEVVRVFQARYRKSENPELENIVSDEVEFHIHLFIRLGVKKAAWSKIGKVSIGSDIELPYFRSSRDFGNPSIKISKNWYVWRVNDPKAKFVGELTSEFQNYDRGEIWPDEALLEILNTGKSSWVYPGY